MSKMSPLPEEAIARKIYWFRGQKVMLDQDLAELYGVLTKRLNEQVRRNPDRFPPHFMFRLTTEEASSLRSQNATSSSEKVLSEWGGRRTQPLVFTEHGILMLSNVLKSERAIAVSIRIIDVFVKMREMLSTQRDILLKLEQLEKRTSRNSGDIQAIFEVLKKMLQTPSKPRVPVGFKIGKR